MSALAALEARARKLDAEERSDVAALLLDVVRHIVDRDVAVSALESRAGKGVPEVEVRRVPGLDGEPVDVYMAGDLIWRFGGLYEPRTEPEKTRAANSLAAALELVVEAHWPAAPREEGPDAAYWCARYGDARVEANEATALCNAALSAGRSEVAARDAEIERLRSEVAAHDEVSLDFVLKADADKRVAEAVAKEREACAAAVRDASDELLRAMPPSSLKRDGVFALRDAAWDAICSRAPASPAGEAPPFDPWCTETIPVSAGGVSGTMRCSLSRDHEGQHECRGPGGNPLLVWPQQEPAGEAPKCVTCGGTGDHYEELPHHPGTFAEYPSRDCHVCNGSGRAAKTSGDGMGSAGVQSEPPVTPSRGAEGPKSPAPSPPPAAPDVDEKLVRDVVTWSRYGDGPGILYMWRFPVASIDREQLPAIAEFVRNQLAQLLTAARAEARREMLGVCERICDLALDDGLGVLTVRARIRERALAEQGGKGE